MLPNYSINSTIMVGLIVCTVAKLCRMNGLGSPETQSEEYSHIGCDTLEKHDAEGTDLFNPGDSISRLISSVSKFLPDYVLSHPRRQFCK